MTRTIQSSLKLSDWIKKKQDPTIDCLYETHFRLKDIRRKTKRYRPIFFVNVETKTFNKILANQIQ